jgi:hypothetical protein
MEGGVATLGKLQLLENDCLVACGVASQPWTLVHATDVMNCSSVS